MSLTSQNRQEVRHPTDALNCQGISLITRHGETIWHALTGALVQPELKTYAALATKQATTAPPIH